MSVKCLLCFLIFLKSSVLTQLSMMYAFVYETTAESLRIHYFLLGWVGWSHWTKSMKDPSMEKKCHTSFRKDDTMETSATKLWTWIVSGYP